MMMASTRESHKPEPPNTSLMDDDDENNDDAVCLRVQVASVSSSLGDEECMDRAAVEVLHLSNTSTIGEDDHDDSSAPRMTTLSAASSDNETPISRFRRDRNLLVPPNLLVLEGDESMRRSKSADEWDQEVPLAGTGPQHQDFAHSAVSDTTWNRHPHHALSHHEEILLQAAKHHLQQQQQQQEQEQRPSEVPPSTPQSDTSSQAQLESYVQSRHGHDHEIQTDDAKETQDDHPADQLVNDTDQASPSPPAKESDPEDPITSCRSSTAILPEVVDEKKEPDIVTDLAAATTTPNNSTRRAQFAVNKEQQVSTSPEIGYTSSIKFTESDVNSVDGLPWNLQHELLDESHSSVDRDEILKRLDGMKSSPAHPLPSTSILSASSFSSLPRQIPEREKSTLPPCVSPGSPDKAKDKKSTMSFLEAANSALNYYVFGITSSEDSDADNVNYNTNRNGDESRRVRWKNPDDTLALLGCAPVIHARNERAHAVPTSLVRVTSEPPPPSYAETIRSNEVDPRMQAWVDHQLSDPQQQQQGPPQDGSYALGQSRTVIVHEIVRRSWTWCTAWSPSGDQLAIGTENHHLAVIDTRASTVWRVLHDQKIKGPMRKDTTHSIRSIEWGPDFIAIGGTGNAVSLLATTEPYNVLHTIPGTGFCGSLDWRGESGILAIASRLDKAIIVRVQSTTDQDSNTVVGSEVLYEIERKNWVNCVAFSPGGSCLAVGDGGGTLGVYDFADEPEKDGEINLMKIFKMEDSILAIEWSPDGKWLYAGGEDFNVTVIDTEYWEVVHKIHRDRWVQCIASSNSGSHMAVGGVSSEISLLDVPNGWQSIMGIELKGVVPLSAKWHPKDQYLAVTGQNNSILAVETTNARHVAGHHLRSVSPILAIEFSPDGHMAIIGNETGVVTFYSLAGSTFVTAYELVVVMNDKLSIHWSLNGVFVAIGSDDALIIVGRRTKDSYGKEIPPSASGLSVRKVVRGLGEIHSVSIDPHSQYVAISGQQRTKILDATADFAKVQEFKENGTCYVNAWSPDGRWFATIGEEKVLTIYDTGHERLDRWRPIFSLQCDFVGRALAWGPLIVGGLLYLAYGGDGNEIMVMEIRTQEGTWETVLRIPRSGPINDMDWNTDGLLAAAIGNGTVSVIDLLYLQSGVAVNERDYDWQRQALTCFTEIRRNRGKNSMISTRWIPSAPGSDSLLAVGGTDGELEIVDLTERQRCRGYVRGL